MNAVVVTGSEAEQHHRLRRLLERLMELSPEDVDAVFRVLNYHGPSPSGERYFEGCRLIAWSQDARSRASVLQGIVDILDELATEDLLALTPVLREAAGRRSEP